jgi:hypothetical protein
MILSSNSPTLWRGRMPTHEAHLNHDHRMCRAVLPANLGLAAHSSPASAASSTTSPPASVPRPLSPAHDTSAEPIVDTRQSPSPRPRSTDSSDEKSQPIIFIFGSFLPGLGRSPRQSLPGQRSRCRYQIMKRTSRALSSIEKHQVRWIAAIYRARVPRSRIFLARRQRTDSS